jgi:hypothetical protein
LYNSLFTRLFVLLNPKFRIADPINYVHLIQIM